LAGIRIYERRWTVKSITAAFLLAIILRVVVCAVTNIVVLLFVAPEFLKFSEYSLKAVGINVASTTDVLLWTLTLNGIFNSIHVILSSIIAMALFRAAMKGLPSVAEKAWLRL